MRNLGGVLGHIHGLPRVMAKRLIFNLVERTDVVVPDAYYPTPPRRFRVPMPDHERLYPPQRD